MASCLGKMTTPLTLHPNSPPFRDWVLSLPVSLRKNDHCETARLHKSLFSRPKEQLLPGVLGVLGEPSGFLADGLCSGEVDVDTVGYGQAKAIVPEPSNCWETRI